MLISTILLRVPCFSANSTIFSGKEIVMHLKQHVDANTLTYSILKAGRYKLQIQDNLWYFLGTEASKTKPYAASYHYLKKLST